MVLIDFFQIKKYNNADGSRSADVLLFTTCNIQGGRLDELDRLLKSVKAAQSADGIAVKHYVLLQNAEPAAYLDIIQDCDFVEVVGISGMISLSKARNLMLKIAIESGDIASARWAAFPDDDAWYPEGVLKEIDEKLLSDGTLLSCKYSSAPNLVTDGFSFNVDGKRSIFFFVQIASSNTIFLSADLLGKTGFFDEALGIGARINGGEDLDYALRALQNSKAVFLDGRALIGHRDKIVELRSRYYAGSLFALFRTSLKNPRVFGVAIRKIFIGGYLLLKKEIGVGGLLKAYVCGFSGLYAPIQFDDN